MRSDLRDVLISVGSRTCYAKGEEIKMRDTFSPDMFLILEGEVFVELVDGDDVDVSISLGRDSIVGEASFLSGRGANANVSAVNDVTGVLLNLEALQRLEEKSPELAVYFSQYLAKILNSRLLQNQVLLGDVEEAATSPIEIVRCVTADDLLRAQKVRYDVYCGEFGRSSPYADENHGTIIDELDGNGVSFLAIDEGGAAIGTVRVNAALDDGLGILPSLYGFENSSHALDRATLITKFAIKEKFRGGTTYMRLFGAVGSYVHAAGNDTIFIDCVPKLARFYATMGFEQCADEFVHYENGLSVPMVLDLRVYTERMPFVERFRKNRWR